MHTIKYHNKSLLPTLSTNRLYNWNIRRHFHNSLIFFYQPCTKSPTSKVLLMLYVYLYASLFVIWHLNRVREICSHPRKAVCVHASVTTLCQCLWLIKWLCLPWGTGWQSNSLRWQVVTHSGVAAAAHCPLSFSNGVMDVRAPLQVLLLCQLLIAHLNSVLFVSLYV